MPAATNKSDLIAASELEWAKLQKVIDRIPEDLALSKDEDETSIKDILGVDTLLLGLALPDCQIHAPNENFTVSNFEGGIRLNRALLEELAK